MSLKKVYEEMEAEGKEVPNVVTIDPRFHDTQLLEHIWSELDKEHKLDYKEKLAVFLICVSAELPDAKDHISGALKGDSASGKDNLIKTCFSLFSKKDNFFLTRATAPAIEDEAMKVKRIAFSEINKDREGANSNITETFKQLSEGGINIIKKDPATGYKTTLTTESEQKTLLFGTTETAIDDELETRYVVIPVCGGKQKNKVVIDDVLEKAQNIDHFLIKHNQKMHWIAESISGLKHNLQVIIPFAEIFKYKVKEENGQEQYLFDYSKERIKRDAKRLLSLTKAVTWLYQKQRKQFERNGKFFVYAEPSDFLVALTIFANFFNLTYSGIDHRLLRTLDCIKQNVGKHTGGITSLKFGYDYADWVLRDKIQRELGIRSRNTIKDHIKKLNDYGLIETHYDQSITNKAYLIRPVSSPVSDLSLPVSLTAIDRCLTVWMRGKNIYSKDLNPIDLSFLSKDVTNGVYTSEKLIGQKLTGQLPTEVHTELPLIITEEFVE
jgi:hypothetical protein